MARNRPRNHHNVQREVARFWRPLRICSGRQHGCEIPFQLDTQRALVWGQDDGVDEATKRFKGLRSGFWMLQGLSQCGDLLTVHGGHSRVQKRRRLVWQLRSARFHARPLSRFRR
jgi:hypothetical protein